MNKKCVEEMSHKTVASTHARNTGAQADDGVADASVREEQVLFDIGATTHLRVHEDGAIQAKEQDLGQVFMNKEAVRVEGISDLDCIVRCERTGRLIILTLRDVRSVAKDRTNWTLVFSWHQYEREYVAKHGVAPELYVKGSELRFETQPGQFVYAFKSDGLFFLQPGAESIFRQPARDGSLHEEEEKNDDYIAYDTTAPLTGDHMNDRAGQHDEASREDYTQRHDLKPTDGSQVVVAVRTRAQRSTAREGDPDYVIAPANPDSQKGPAGVHDAKKQVTWAEPLWLDIPKRRQRQAMKSAKTSKEPRQEVPRS